jgi:hypothetical protein
MAYTPIPVILDGENFGEIIEVLPFKHYFHLCPFTKKQITGKTFTQTLEAVRQHHLRRQPKHVTFEMSEGGQRG